MLSILLCPIIYLPVGVRSRVNIFLSVFYVGGNDSGDSKSHTYTYH